MRLLRTVMPLLLTACMIGCSQKTTPDSTSDFRLNQLDGKRFYLNQHADQTVCLVFWATSCAPCKVQLTAFEKLRRKLPQDKVLIAGVCMDPADKEKVQSIVDSFKLTMPILLDENAKIAKRYGIEQYPVTLVIRNADEIVLRRVGYDSTIHKQVENALYAAIDE